jgi:hypothetical protein
VCGAASRNRAEKIFQTHPGASRNLAAVTPAQAGAHFGLTQTANVKMGSSLRWNDDLKLQRPMFKETR